MKKLLVKILCLVLSVACLCGVFSACDLVKTDSEKNSKLVIAKIKIDDVEQADLNVDGKTLYKKDLYAGYVSYGYYYVDYYGYTTSKAFETVLDNLVNNTVVEQYAKRRLTQFYATVKAKTEAERTEFEKYFYDNVYATTEYSGVLTAKSNLDAFLTEYQILEAKYEVKNSIASIIKQNSNKDEDTTKSTEKVTLEERKNPSKDEDRDFTEQEMRTEVPTDKEYKTVLVKLNKECTEENLSAIKAECTNLYDLNVKLFKEFNYDLSSRANRKAFNKGIENLKAYGIISSDEFYSSQKVEKYAYFVDALASEKVQALVNTFESFLEKDVESQMTGDMLYSAYDSLYETQKTKYDTKLSDYETALSDVTEDTFIVYNPLDNYGYVSNLLIGFSDQQSTALKNYKAKAGVTAQEVKNFRANLAGSIVAKDQRAYWVVNSYGSYDGTSFVFDSKYLKSENSLVGKYLGTVNNPVSTTKKDSDGVEETTWTCDSVYANSIKFENFVNDYLKAIGMTSLSFFGSGTISTLDYNDEFKNNFEDLLYAFSTDPGCLGKLYGYLYSPNGNQYVEEFNDCAKALVENGVGSYSMVVTDYGIHVMVCTKKVEKNVEKILKADFTSWDKYEDFKKSKIDSLVSNQVQKELNNFISNYLEDDSTAVKYFKNNYSDLITE